MTDKKKNIKPDSNKPYDPMDIVTGTYIDWGKSKEQAWLELEKKMESVQPEVPGIVFRPWIKMAMAATITLLVGFAIFMQLYTRTITIPVGQHSRIYLPDHSSVQLNAQSSISYKPLLYRFSRIINFEGEAFFEVQKGKKFEVVSDHGITNVLGTTFNVYARNSDYRVSCISGNVKVTGTRYNQVVFLNPGQQAIINPAGNLEVQSGIDKEQVLSWLNNKFSFTSVSLVKVIKEIERQYGVVIRIPEGQDYIYTGTFRLDTSIEETLNLVCKPFNLTFTRKSKDEYIITRIQ